jgi:hypothetical protein
MEVKVLDLFSGLGGWSQAFAARSHQVVTVDIELGFKPTLCADIMTLTLADFGQWAEKGQTDPGSAIFDVILASPPCNCFSVASIYRHWKDSRPKDDATVKAIKLVGHTLDLIISLHPRFWILENPRGMMRHVLGKPAITTFYAAWGMPYLKPTDLWGVLPDIAWRKPTKWEKAPRGAHTGVQSNAFGIRKRWPVNMSNSIAGPALRAKVPYALSEAVCLACEKALNVHNVHECHAKETESHQDHGQPLA